MVGVICLWALTGCIDDEEGLPKTVAEVAERLKSDDEEYYWLSETLRKHPEFVNAAHGLRKLIWVAISNDKRRFLEEFIAAGAEIDAPTAAFLGEIDWLERHFKRGGDIEEVFEIDEHFLWNWPWHSLLRIAVRGGQAKTVAYLLKKGSKRFEHELKQLKRGDLLTDAAYFGDEETVDLLIQTGAANAAEAAFSLCHEPERLPMLAHLLRRIPELVTHVYAAKDDDRPFRRAGSTLLMLAVGNPGAVELLLASGARANAKDVDGRNAIDYLRFHAGPSPRSTAKRLRAAGAEWSPGTLLCYGDVDEIEKAIRDGRLGVNAPFKFDDPRDRLPLVVATEAGRPEVIKFLIARGADPFQRLENEPSAVALIEHGVVGRQALAALLSGLDDKGRQRLRAWRDDKRGDTPLHTLAVQGNIAAIRLLLKAGVDRTVRNKYGKTAADLACNDVVRRELQ